MKLCSSVVSADGRTWTCPVCGFGPRPARTARIHRPCGNANDPHGPGTQLKLLLARLGIVAVKDCQCDAGARLMNARGPDWCQANADTIVGWLRDEAARRRRWFFAPVARQIVRVAIGRARRAALRRSTMTRVELDR